MVLPKTRPQRLRWNWQPEAWSESASRIGERSKERPSTSSMEVHAREAEMSRERMYAVVSMMVRCEAVLNTNFRFTPQWQRREGEGEGEKEGVYLSYNAIQHNIITAL